MLSFIFRTDVHAADRSPASWKGDYPAEIWDNLRQVGVMATKYKAQAVLDGGDFFHVKAANRNSHALIIQTAKIHSQYPCPTWSIEGNHDLSANDLDSLDKQPLGVLYESGIFRHLVDEVFEQDAVRVRVVGVPYKANRTLEELRAIQKQPGDTHLIAIVHALSGKNPPAHVEDFFGEPVFRYSDLVTSNGPDVWCFGHYHKDQGIEKIDGRFFVNQGALSRGALVRENLERIPKAALLTFDASSIRVESLPMKVAPADMVFDLDRKERHDQEIEVIDQFVARLESNAVSFDPALEVATNIQNLAYAADVREMALEYLERARSDSRRT